MLFALKKSLPPYIHPLRSFQLFNLYQKKEGLRSIRKKIKPNKIQPNPKPMEAKLKVKSLERNIFFFFLSFHKKEEGNNLNKIFISFPRITILLLLFNDFISFNSRPNTLVQVKAIVYNISHVLFSLFNETMKTQIKSQTNLKISPIIFEFLVKIEPSIARFRC